MKKKIGILMTLICLGLVGCGNDTMIKSNANAIVHESGTYEWISPDGVHYWICSYADRFGIAPRYDSNGQLVID